MDNVMKYITIAVIIYAVGMDIYKTVRSRTIDYLLWAIVGLFGIVIWLSRGFLITCQMYDWATWVVCLLTIGSFILSKQSKASRWIRYCSLTCLSLAVIGFVTLDIIAKPEECIVIETPLNGYSTARIDEVYFRYNGKSFSRNFNLEDYSGGGDLRKNDNVECTIIPITSGIVKMESLDLVPKQELINRKGGNL